LSHLPLAWSEQTRKPEPTRPRLQQPPKRLGAFPRRVHIRGVPVKEHPRRTVLSGIARSNTPDRPFTTCDTRVYRRVSNESSTMDKPTEYFDSARKTCKKTGSGDFSQIAYLTENLTKLNKSKKHSKTCSLLVR